MHLLPPEPHPHRLAGPQIRLGREHRQKLAAAAGEVVGGVGVEGESGLVLVGARVEVGEERGAEVLHDAGGGR